MSKHPERDSTRRRGARRPRYTAVHKIALAVVMYHNPNGECADWDHSRDQHFFVERARLSQPSVSKAFKKLFGLTKGERPSRAYLSFFRSKRVADLYSLAVNRLLEVGLDYRESGLGSNRVDYVKVLDGKAVAEHRRHRRSSGRFCE